MKHRLQGDLVKSQVLIIDDRKLENFEILSKCESDEMKHTLAERVPSYECEESCPGFLDSLVQNTQRVLLMSFLPPRKHAIWNQWVQRFNFDQVLAWNSSTNEKIYRIELSGRGQP